MDPKTNAAFVSHVRHLENMAIGGNESAAKSLACMALLVEGWRPIDPDGGEVIDLMPYLKAA